MTHKRLLICSSGLPGSGKGVLLEAAKRMVVRCVVMGDIVRREAERVGLGTTAASVGRLAVESRKRYGKDCFAKLTAEEIKVWDESVVLVDGVRNVEELEHFKSRGWRVTTVAMMASPIVRFGRLKKRGRNDDPENYVDFLKRDKRELELGIGQVLLLADHYLVNQSLTWERAVEEAGRLIEEILDQET